MVAWVVIDRQQPRQAGPFASLLSTPAIPLPHLSPLLPTPYGHSYTTAAHQPLCNQFVTHSFSSRRGCTPPRGFNCLCPTPYPLSPFFSNTCALFCISLHFFALTKNSTHFFSSDSALFAENTRGGGGATNPRFPRLAFLHCIR